MKTKLNQIPDVVESVFPPVVINTPSGRFAVYGDAGWFPVDENFTTKDAEKRWHPSWKNNFTTPDASLTNIKDIRELVPNSKKTGHYTVTFKGGKWGCSCKGWIFHQSNDCKHIKQVKKSRGLV